MRTVKSKVRTDRPLPPSDTQLRFAARRATDPLAALDAAFAGYVAALEVWSAWYVSFGPDCGAVKEFTAAKAKVEAWLALPADRRSRVHPLYGYAYPWFEVLGVEPVS